MKKTLLTLLILIINFSVLTALENKDSLELGFKYGIYGRYFLNEHFSSFRHYRTFPAAEINLQTEQVKDLNSAA